MSRRIALFGGSFDPFHLGHFLVAQKVREEFKPERIVFLPCAHSPLKKLSPTASNHVRLECLRLSLRGIPWAEVSDWEIRQKGPSYSVHTARRWRKEYPKIALDLILGSDQWSQIRQWREYRSLGQMVRFLVFPRPHQPRPVAGLRMKPVSLRIDLSASEIRERIKNGLPIKGMVFPEVEKMIKKNRIYR
ncbi:nicotinate (nicotinamide) nucleotide adenylyltransferase [bacterium]|nr:nicotinate (nicotinamide) nucleotide adenylyltransferase [bacterium]